jgi:predicted acylesterase/phospholipase RssA
MATFDRPDRCCDLVLKGGITSGILYPPAICRIAERFHLIGIGGTSAGAIAACAAAAAEYRRRTTGDGAGFDRLEQLPYELAGDGRLLGLFRPDAPTRRLFRLFLDATRLDGRGWLARTRWKTRALWAGINHRSTLRPLVDNGYGLCSGMANGYRPTTAPAPPLTEWLTDLLDEIAGLEVDRPLTFGDLRHAPVPSQFADVMTGVEERSIDLRAVTTCVSFGRPLEAPFDGMNLFAFDPAEWRGLFPKRVVDYLVAASREIEAPSLTIDGKLPLPVGDALPVVVAARMSLSFPCLFSMVPLYAVDYEAETEPMRRVWFSDGGITSNLPIHRFDALFPRWPTLAINLQYADGDGRIGRRGVDAHDLVSMISRPGDGTNDLWHLFDGGESSIKRLLGFVGAVFRSAQVWHDNGYLRLPGYRDRVVEIWLQPHEGGLNLEMPEDVIRGLVERGNLAGTRLRDRFADPTSADPLSWDGHRWTRLRSGLAGLAAYLSRFGRSVGHPQPGDAPIWDLLANRERPPSYRLRTDQQLQATREGVEEILALVEGLAAKPGCVRPDEVDQRPFCGGPRPHLEIGSRAPI